MPASKNTGTCLLCKQDIQHRTATKHIQKCLGQHSASDETVEKEKVFLIKVNAGKAFWLYLELNGSATLETLDAFLRDAWLECCGHLSQFSIQGARYHSDGGMEKVIHRTMPVKTQFYYEYDFGSTTTLAGKVLSARPGRLQKRLRLLAQNHIPSDVQCTACDSFPEVICTGCYDFFCATCKQEHAYCGGEDYMLPVVNSPRMGVCGYSGPNTLWMRS